MTAETTLINALLIEDDLIVQRVHTMMLTKLGCKVEIAADGLSALKKVTDFAYDIIFVDIGLPDISGFEVIEKIKAINRNFSRNIPIIALTGYTGEQEKQDCKQAGASEVIYKPVLAQTMRAVLSTNLATIS